MSSSMFSKIENIITDSMRVNILKRHILGMIDDVYYGLKKQHSWKVQGGKMKKNENPYDHIIDNIFIKSFK